MSENKQRPSRWLYVLAIMIPIFACLGTSLLVYLKVPDIPGTLETIGTKNLTQVVVPGSADVSLPKKGAYAVYYEYRTAFDGVSYYRGQYPPSIRCQLRSKDAGEVVRLAPTNVKGNVYITQNPKRAGVMFKQISIDQPGVYTFSCQYPDGSSNPKIVMAVGPNLVLEFFNIAAKPVAAIFGGALAFLVACGLSLLIIGFVAIMRHNSKTNLTSQAQRNGGT